MGSLHCEFAGYALQLARYQCQDDAPLSLSLFRYRLSITSPGPFRSEENPSSWLRVTCGDKLCRDFEFHTRNRNVSKSLRADPY